MGIIIRNFRETILGFVPSSAMTPRCRRSLNFRLQTSGGWLCYCPFRVCKRAAADLAGLEENNTELHDSWHVLCFRKETCSPSRLLLRPAGGVLSHASVLDGVQASKVSTWYCQCLRGKADSTTRKTWRLADGLTLNSAPHKGGDPD